MDTRELVEALGKTELLPTNGAESGGDQEPFSRVVSESFYVPTGLTMSMHNQGASEVPASVFVVARGATGKTALARHVAYETHSPLWSTAKDFTINALSLKLRLQEYLQKFNLESVISGLRNPLVVIDAVDEAEVRVSSESWGEFKSSLVEFARVGLRFLILGRELALLDIMEQFESEDMGFTSYYLESFNEDQQVEFIDSSYRRSGGKTALDSNAYQDSRDTILNNLRQVPIGGDEMRSFVGYAPVLEAVAMELVSQSNLSRAAKKYESEETWSSAKRIVSIIEAILDREQEKFKANIDQDAFGDLECYTNEEQILSILYRFGLVDEQPLPPLLVEEKEKEYKESREKQLKDHPFLDSSHENRWSSKVFEAYCLALYDQQIVDRHRLYELAARNPLFAILAPEVFDERTHDDWAIAALHASLIASSEHAPHESSTGLERLSAVIIPIGEEGLFSYVTSGLRGANHSRRSEAALRVTFASKGRDELVYRGPLSRITIFAPGSLVTLKPVERAPFLGPLFTLHCDLLEFDTREVKLASIGSGGYPAVMLFANDVEIPMPFFDLNDQRRINRRPRLCITGGSEAFQRVQSSVGYPWVKTLLKVNLVMYRDRNPVPNERIFRIVEECRALSTNKFRRAGMERVAWCARVGIPNDSELAETILDILVGHGVLRYENGIVFYADENPDRVLFATPYLKDSGSRPEFFDLNSDQQKAWGEVFIELNRALFGDD